MAEQAQLSFLICDQWNKNPAASGKYVARVCRNGGLYSYAFADILVNEQGVSMDFRGGFQNISTVQNLYPSIEFLGPL